MGGGVNETMQPSKSAGGLEDAVVADTRVSCIDGEVGRFWIRGRDIATLCGSLTFEELCELLWDESERASTSGSLSARLAQGRIDAFALVPTLSAALNLPDSMDALRSAMSHLRPQGDSVQIRAQITGAVAVFVAAWKRMSARREPIAPRATAAHAADYLYMLNGCSPTIEQIGTLDAYLVTLAEHDLMASTFVARVIASTNSDPLSAVVGALGALKGSAHGGAIAPVLEMIRTVGTPERAPEWVREQVNNGQRIMGMGHRVYRTRDPRATALERVLEARRASGHCVAGLAVACAIERAVQNAFAERHPGSRIAANVELFAAVLLDHLSLTPELFTPTYAVACVSGWLAHYDEQITARRLIRPRSRYVGPAPAK
jgi:citrate synthase